MKTVLLVYIIFGFVATALLAIWTGRLASKQIAETGSLAAPAKTETLSCVRVKQVTPAGTINYLCEVRK